MILHVLLIFLILKKMNINCLYLYLSSKYVSEIFSRLSTRIIECISHHYFLKKVLTIKNDIATIKILYETSIEYTDSINTEVYYDKRRTS